MTIIVNIDRRHAAAMPTALSDIRQRITDIEERASLPRASPAAVIRHVDRRCNIVRMRMWSRIREQAI